MAPCSHKEVVYFHSAGMGNYAVCRGCGDHLWAPIGSGEEGIKVPSGAAVVDLDAEEEDECEQGQPIDDWKKAVSEWRRG